MLLLLLLAWATYLLVRVIQRRGVRLVGDDAAARPTPSPRPGPSRRPGRPAKPRLVAPDDDEEFLRELDRKRLHPDDPDSPS